MNYECISCGKPKKRKTKTEYCITCYNNSRIGSGIIPEIFERNCPKCNRSISYKSKYAQNNAEKENRLCKSCMLKGRTYIDIHGEKNAQKRKEATANAHRGRSCPWNIKTAENRKKNGGYVVSDSQKEKLSQNTFFRGKFDEEHPRIKKFLKDQNITFEEYQKRLTECEKYRRLVRRITDKQPIHLLEHCEKRGRTGEDGAYHLDHIIQIKQGFIEKISPEIVGHISNLRFIPWRENLTRRRYTW